MGKVQINLKITQTRRLEKLHQHASWHLNRGGERGFGYEEVTYMKVIASVPEPIRREE